MSGNFDYNEFVDIEKDFQEKKIEKASLLKNITSLKKKHKLTLKKLDKSKKARVVFQEVAEITQNNLKLHISKTVTSAIYYVSKDYPEFVMKISKRRNKSEVDFLFRENGKEQDPMESAGHGAVDICAFATRITMGELKHTRPLYFFDEPFRNLSPDKENRASKMVKMLCDKLGLQIVIVSHGPDICNYADKIFQVTKVGKISEVKEMENVR